MCTPEQIRPGAVPGRLPRRRERAGNHETQADLGRIVRRRVARPVFAAGRATFKENSMSTDKMLDRCTKAKLAVEEIRHAVKEVQRIEAGGTPSPSRPYLRGEVEYFIAHARRQLAAIERELHRDFHCPEPGCTVAQPHL